MSYLSYKVLHILGVLMTTAALGGLTLHAVNRGSQDHSGRKLAGMTHGIALLIVLVSGFGMIAKLQVGFPLWIWVKVLIWLLIGASIALIRRMPQHAQIFWFLIPLLGTFAAYLCLFKPWT